ncbi:MAG: hypothetical protein LQ345_003403 [Seirophora villosa]|nr:MAG: hypothetical protein LQ345_003403 [Seirophora villosa]
MTTIIERESRTGDEGKKGLLDLPNEVIEMIVAERPATDLKHIRLVCKTLLPFATGKLFIHLYVSPREQDMLVFDAVTQRSDLRKSISTISFDTARFIEAPTIEQYYLALCDQLRSKAFQYLRAIDPSIQKVAQLLGIRKEEHTQERNGRSLSPSTYMKRWGQDESFIDGYLRYVRFADEHRNLFSQTWFSRVLHGLQSLGRLDNVHLVNSFDLYYELTLYRHGRHNPVRPKRRKKKRDLSGASHGQTDRKRVVGSPSARSWPLKHLQPSHPVLENREFYAHTNQERKNSTRDGSVELIRTVELLKLAKIQPRHFFVAREGDTTFHGIPPSTFFEKHWSGRTSFSDISKNLTELRLQFDTSKDYEMGQQQPQTLFQLTSCLGNMPVLRKLALKLPLNRPYFRLPQVFPSVTDWDHPQLQWLELTFVSSSYSDLIGLLFLGFPKLVTLYLDFVQLVGGDWDDIIEGLHRLSHLRYCHLVGLSHLVNGTETVYHPQSAEYSLEDYQKLMGAFDSYVIHGGRHPSLSEGLPDSHSQLYMDRLTKKLDPLRALKLKKKAMKEEEHSKVRRKLRESEHQNKQEQPTEEHDRPVSMLSLRARSQMHATVSSIRQTHQPPRPHPPKPKHQNSTTLSLPVTMIVPKRTSSACAYLPIQAR